MSLDVRGALRAIGRTQVRGEAITPVVETGVRPQTGRIVQRDSLTLVQGDAQAGERKAAIALLASHYYPIGRHPNLHLVERLDLNAIGPLGRFDEVGHLQKAALAMPHALAGDFRSSPKAAGEDAERINTHRAFRDHARLVNELLLRGTKVYLMVQPTVATEAVYNTDIVTGIADRAVVSSPLQKARRAELPAYSGGVQLDADGKKPGPIEWGDLLLASRDGKLYICQGYDSMRGTIDSVGRLARVLDGMRKRGHAIEHVPIQLAGENTLHLDYAANYCGTGDSRSMLICPDAIANKSDIDRLQWIFQAKDSHVHSVDAAAMLEAAANISAPSPNEVFIAANAFTESTREFLASRGVDVIALPFQMTKKDGAFHCCVGQLLRG